MTVCACGSEKEYQECCEPYIAGTAYPSTAEALLRSRYTAFTEHKISYLMGTVHPDNRSEFNRDHIRDWAQKSRWEGLDVLSVSQGGPDDMRGEVEFVAHFLDGKTAKRHHELAYFRKQADRWYFYDGVTPKPKQFTRVGPKLSRNDPCPCGSGKKRKKCCKTAC